MGELKKSLAAIYAWLIVAGVIVGPVGMIVGFPVIGAIGNATFLAGVFTPILFQWKLTAKDAIFGGVWSSTVIYFGFKGFIDLYWLLAFFPVLVVSMLVSKWAGSSFTQPLKTNN